MGCQLNTNSGVIGHQQHPHSLSQMGPLKPTTPKERISSGSQYICRIEDITDPPKPNKWNNSNAHHNTGNAAKFSIIESNQFRELTHLSLNLQPGTDALVRSYLSTIPTEILRPN